MLCALAASCGDNTSDGATADAGASEADVDATIGTGAAAGTGGIAGSGGGPLDASQDVLNDAISDVGPEANFDAGAICSRWAQALCGLQVKCWPIAQQHYVTLAGCIDALTPFCEVSVTLPGASPANLAACSTALETGSFSCDDWSYGPTPSTCTSLGTLDEGQPCVSSIQCKDNACTVDYLSLCGTCSPKGVQGAACAYSHDCREGYACSGSFCTQAAYLGEACDTATPCNPPLICVAGKCEKPQGIGAPCTQSEDCDSAQGALNCFNGTCEQYLAYQAGEACTYHGACVYPYNCISGICALPFSTGAACTSHAQCAQPAYYCIAGKCQPPHPSLCP